jgi:cell division protein YceG involved in septum cleavage
LNRPVKTMILILTVLWFVVGCGDVTNKQSEIFDNQVRLMESADSYTFTKKTGDITNEQGVANFSGFSGVYTVWNLTSAYDVTTNLTISGKIERGNFKLIQITSDHQLVTLWEGGEDKDISISIPEGNSAIKWVGQNSAGHVSIQLEQLEGLEVQPQGDLFDDSQ